MNPFPLCPALGLSCKVCVMSTTARLVDCAGRPGEWQPHSLLCLEPLPDGTVVTISYLSPINVKPEIKVELTLFKIDTPAEDIGGSGRIPISAKAIGYPGDNPPRQFASKLSFMCELVRICDYFNFTPTIDLVEYRELNPHLLASMVGIPVVVAKDCAVGLQVAAAGKRVQSG